MKKQTKVLLAAAALTLGASFTAMAATYDWKMEDGQWLCYDEDGDLYEDEWVESAGKDYYVGEDGVLAASEWVDGFYVDSTGAKTTNAWKNILPEGVDEDDEDAEAKWFYFGSKGAITKGKKVIDGQTYYFDGDGEMLTGWITYANEVAAPASVGAKDNLVYLNEDGSRAANMWIKTVAPGVDEEEEDEPDYFWYYIGSKGAPKTGRQLDINGETYFFNAAGQMLTGWVALDKVQTTVYTNANAQLKTYGDVYFCGTEDQGWAQKSKWINEYRSTVDTADVDDDSMYWFWVDSKGKVLKATATDSNAATEMKFYAEGDVHAKDATAFTATYATTKEINGKDYIFNQNGEMLSGLVEYKNELFYYGGSADGSMKTGEVVLEEAAEEESYNFYFAKTKKDGYNAVGAAVTGAAAGKLYNGGILVTHDADEKYDEASVEIDGVTYYFVIDENGNIKTSNKEYKVKNDDGEYTTYIDTTNTEFLKTGTLKGAYKVSAEK